MVLWSKAKFLQLKILGGIPMDRNNLNSIYAFRIDPHVQRLDDKTHYTDQQSQEQTKRNDQ